MSRPALTATQVLDAQVDLLCRMAGPPPGRHDLFQLSR